MIEAKPLHTKKANLKELNTYPASSGQKSKEKIESIFQLLGVT
jgi:hypothetical protein